MATPELPTPYITLVDADAYLGSREPWTSSSDELKNDALSYGRLYIDQNYHCPNVDFSGEIPSEIQIANAELANLYLTDSLNLYPSQEAKNLVETKVKAGSVESLKKYNSGATSSIDTNPQISALITNVCYFSSGGGAKPVVRS